MPRERCTRRRKSDCPAAHCKWQGGRCRPAAARPTCPRTLGRRACERRDPACRWDERAGCHRTLPDDPPPTGVRQWWCMRSGNRCRAVLRAGGRYHTCPQLTRGSRGHRQCVAGRVRRGGGGPDDNDDDYDGGWMLNDIGPSRAEWQAAQPPRAPRRAARRDASPPPPTDEDRAEEEDDASSSAASASTDADSSPPPPPPPPDADADADATEDDEDAVPNLEDDVSAAESADGSGL